VASVAVRPRPPRDQRPRSVAAAHALLEGMKAAGGHEPAPAAQCRFLGVEIPDILWSDSEIGFLNSNGDLQSAGPDWRAVMGPQACRFHCQVGATKISA